jgi:hypothetical protein
MRSMELTMELSDEEIEELIRALPRGRHHLDVRGRVDRALDVTVVTMTRYQYGMSSEERVKFLEGVKAAADRWLV